ncbi:UNKNOWN [Stylonychia lemnae]|uniref:Uncharacterized protein n=1 Tax=Stylonychia lemnae TaxID=5949 RepID=A0A078ANY8_STYLE|nr:UNKNOWN [Stylonychia lemnae]|eukprot:CDW84090.1 UNKNOWN [Stylonychia lemnae]
MISIDSMQVASIEQELGQQQYLQDDGQHSQYKFKYSSYVNIAFDSSSNCSQINYVIQHQYELESRHQDSQALILWKQQQQQYEYQQQQPKQSNQDKQSTQRE